MSRRQTRSVIALKRLCWV